METNIPLDDMVDLKLEYGGGNEIDANTYINSLIHFTNIIQEVNKELSKRKKVQVKIKAHDKGSFIVDLAISSVSIIDDIKDLFGSEKISYAANLVGVVEGIYAFVKFLKGKSPRSVENINNNLKVENNDGEINYFDLRGANIYLNNPIVKSAVEQEFETLESDENVTSFQLTALDGSPIVSFEKDEFFPISSSGAEELPENNQKIESVTANLNIVSLDWEFKRKWEFYYNGNKIPAKIKDDAFGERIEKGERFGKGDTLVVEMDIKKEYDESVNSYINKGYIVNKIIKHIDRPIQTKLDFK